MKTMIRHLLVIFVPVLLATACNKSSDAIIPDNPDGIPAPAKPTGNPANDVVETKPAVQKGVTVTVNANIGGFMQALPARYDSTTKRYPLLVFLHGIGELGNGASQLANVAGPGVPGLIRNKKFPASFKVKDKNYSFIVITPQFKAWPSPNDVNAMISYAISKYRIDTTRIYVSGLSMGGGVTWDYAGTYPKRLAAIVPICGAAGPTDTKVKNMVNAGLPVWAFHNEDDPTVSVNNSKNYVSKINALKPAVPARLTLWPTGGHDAWTKATSIAYKENGMNMYEWMLQYSRTVK
jgi:predicted peptidase